MLVYWLCYVLLDGLAMFSRVLKMLWVDFYYYDVRYMKFCNLVSALTG